MSKAQNCMLVFVANFSFTFIHLIIQQEQDSQSSNSLELRHAASLIISA